MAWKAMPRVSDEQEKKWYRDCKKDHALAAPDPFVNTSKFVTDRRNKWQNGKFRSNVAARIAGPIDLRIRKMKTSFAKIPCNCCDIALAPAPVVDVRLIDQNQSSRYGNYPDGDCNLPRTCSRRPVGDAGPGP
jgi:hypothetical protein